MKKNIAIVYGGYSSEIIVSEKSMLGVRSFIDAEKYTIYPVRITKEAWLVMLEANSYAINKNDFSFEKNGEHITFDCAYITIHGTPGENGLFQGYLEMLDIPHTTCGVLTAALTFNKFTCNTYLKGFGVAVADSILIRKNKAFNSKDIVKKLGLPCFVKPNAGGSSFGISKVKKEEDITPAIERALLESDEVIIEQYINGQEFTCGLYKTKTAKNIFPITEVVSKNEFFDFEAKYTEEMADEITPARLPKETTERIQSISSLIYDILGCKGIVRIDYMLSDKKIYLLEVNTTPGMTQTSFIPQQIAADNRNIADVFTEILEDAMN